MDAQLSDLFEQCDYKLTNFNHKDVNIDLYCSTSATTDFDLTGQIIWPSAIELAKYIIDNQAIFKDKTILELGAGAGLSGFVACKYATKVYITDGNEKVQALIEMNVNHLKYQNASSQLFQWGEQNSKQFGNVDIIIGADIIFWPSSLMPLVETLNYFFKLNPQVQVIIGGIKRMGQTEDNIDKQLKLIGLRRDVILTNSTEYAQVVYIYKIQAI